MPSQAHRIKIEADQQSALEALTTAEGWSGWFTLEVTGDFTEGSEIVCELWSTGSRHSAGVCIDPIGRTPSHARQEWVIVRLSGALDHAVSSLRAFSGSAPPRARRRVPTGRPLMVAFGSP